MTSNPGDEPNRFGRFEAHRRLQIVSPRHPTVDRADLSVWPVWSESLGAKTACCLVETPDLSICIDPGVAAMQPSYPLSSDRKRRYERLARAEIRDAVRRADHVVISHYHYDHYFPDPDRYPDVELWVKEPNRWINDSQWKRSRSFLEAMAVARGERLRDGPPRQTRFADPTAALPHAMGRDFGDYGSRRTELLERWRERYDRRVQRWSTMPWIEEPPFVRYADGRSFETGNTRVRFHGPLFHGIEYSSTGWVVSTVVETPGAKFIHSSDLEGPVIEDYADWIIEEDPDVLFLDGPPTYLLGFLLNRITLRRSVANAKRIVREAAPDVVLFDHHLLRDRRYRARTGEVWDLDAEGRRVTTVAGIHGKAPLIDRLHDSTDSTHAD